MASCVDLVRIRAVRSFIIPADKKGQIGYTYTLCKEKDYQKTRPIVSNFYHPFKKMQNACSRILLFLLTLVDWEHLNMFKISDITEQIKQISEKILQGHIFQAHVGDVKNAYTELIHWAITNAYTALFQNFKNLYPDVHYVHVAKKGTKGVHLHKTQNISDFWNIPLQEVYHFALWNLQNGYFTCLGILLLQVIGVTMGDALSPPALMIVCAFCEHKFFMTLESQKILNSSWRYMDDLTALIRTRSTQEAKKILNYYVTTTQKD